MANQNFKVKKGLEVGTGVTISDGGVNITGVITAAQFSGDGSGLTGVTAAGSGVVVQEEGSSVGTAATINFIGSNVTAAISGGVASVTITGGGDVVTDTTPQLGGNLDLNSKNITGTGNISITGGFNATGVSTFQESVTFQSHASFGDGDKAIFGADQDLQIYHSGSNGIIENTTGSLYIRDNTNNVFIQGRSGENSGVFRGDGAVELYYNNSKKIETTSNGVDVTGRLLATGSLGYGLVFNDSVKISLGSNNDLLIYHNGTNSIIDNDTGTLLLRSNEDDKDILLQSDDGSGGVADYIRCDGSAGEVRLYHYGNEKLNTKSDGIDVTGEVQCDSLDVDGAVNIDGSKVTYDSSNGLKLADSTQLRLGSGNDLRLYHTGTHSYIQDAGTGNLVIQSNRIDFQTAAGTAEMARFQDNGAVSLSFNGSTKFETTNHGVTITGVATATSFSGSGSSLTGLTGASAGTYGASNITPVITVDSNGRITGISTVDTAGGGGGGGGISNLSEDTTPQLGGDLDMNGNDITSNVTIVSTDSGNAAAPELSLYRNSSSPAAADYIGQIKFQGESSSGATRLYAKITGKIGDPTNGSEDGIIEIAHRKNGSNNISARWNQDELQLINGTELSLGDSQKIKLGASDDLQIYHNGSYSVIADEGTGELVLSGNRIQLMNAARSEKYIDAFQDGAVNIYHDNALRLKTTGTGVNITDDLNVAGISTFTGNVSFGSTVTFGDDDRIRLGDSNEFDIYYSGGRSYIKSGVGQLRVKAASSMLFMYENQAGTQTESYATFSHNGAVSLFYDGSKKFETASGGATVTGTLTATAFSGDGSALTNLPASGITTSQSNTQVTYNVGASGNNYVITGPGYSNSDNNPDLYLVRGQRYRFINATGSSHPFRIQSDTSGTAYTDGVSGSQSGTQEFNVQHDAPSRLFYQCTIHSGMIGNIYITGGGQWENTSVAASGTPKVYTDYAVGIGTVNPSKPLQVHDDSASAVLITGPSPQIRLNSNVTDSSDNDRAMFGLATGNGHFVGGAVAGDAVLRTTNGGNLLFGEGTTERVRITSAGTLKVGSNTLVSPNGNADNFVIDTGDVDSGLSILSATTGRIYFGDAADNDVGSIRYVHTDNSMRFETAASERLRLFSDGSVRIGDNSIAVAAVGGGPTLGINGAAPEITLRDSASGNPYAVMRTNDFGSLTLEADQGNDAANSTIHFRVDNAERMRINSSYLLHGDTASDLSGTHATMFCGSNHAFQHDGDTGTYLTIALGAANGTVDLEADARSGNYPDMRFITTNTERLRITADGRLLVGGSTSARSTFFNSSSWTPQVQIENTSDQKSSLSLICSHATNNQAGLLALGATKSSSLGGNGLTGGSQGLGIITFQGNDDSQMVEAARIACVAAGTPSANNVPGSLRFSVNSGSSGATEKMRLTSSGFLQLAGNNGTIDDGNEHIFRQGQNSYNVLQLRAESNSYAASGGGAFAIGVTRSASSSYTFAGWYSGNGSTPFSDREYNFRGDGHPFSDGSSFSNGADYAEYFEWSDGNPTNEDRRGLCVVLDGDKIREAAAGEDPIGVVSGNPSVVGDSAWNKWKDKYLRDEYGSYLLDENGERQLNPDYDPDTEYTSREDRPEWDIVGLMGKIRIRTGQVTGSRWIKMRDISANVQQWLVR